MALQPTIYRISEEILKALSGGDIQAASNISINEIKISVGQVINQLLKIDYLKVNLKMGEMIPNGSVLGLYEGIAVTSYGTGRSKATLPIKPLKLPRNMGVYAIYPNYNESPSSVYELDKEFIPLQMGQSSLLKSQPLISDLIGQVGYETFGMELIFNKDLKLLFPNITLAMRLAIMDISQYDDWDILPILPDQEWQVKQEVIKIYSQVGVSDLLVDSSNKQQQGIPVQQQQQT